MTTRDLRSIRAESRGLLDESYRSGFEHGQFCRPHDKWQDMYQKKIDKLVNEAYRAGSNQGYRTGARDERRFPERHFPMRSTYVTDCGLVDENIAEEIGKLRRRVETLEEA